MTRIPRAITLLACALMGSVAFAQRILIGADPASATSLDMAFEVANQFEKEFTFQIVLANLTDPTFRQAVQEEGLNVNLEKLNAKDFVRVAADLKSEFAIWISGIRKDGRTESTIEVFKGRGNRSIFKKSNNGYVEGGVNPTESAYASIVRLWVLDLQKDLFKTYRRRESESSTGNQNTGVTVTINPPQNPLGVSSAALQEARKLLDQGLDNQAIQYLYEAIDLFPDDLEIRLMLSEVLLQQNRSDENLALVRSTLLLFPGEISLRIALIQGLLDQGDWDQASLEINEGLARQPENPDLLALSGDWSMMNNRPDRARATYLKVMSLKPTHRHQVGLATAMALDGDVNEAQRLMQGLQGTQPADIDAIYSRFIRIVKRAAPFLAEELREIIRLQRLGTKELQPKMTRLSKQIQGLSVASSAIPVPASRKSAHENRVLAYKLLAQAAGQALLFVQTQDEDLASEAQISLSDAVRRLDELDRTN